MVQVLWHEALLLHQPQNISVDMSKWRGHFGTLTPFYAACEQAGGFVGRAQNVVGAPEELRGGFTRKAAISLKRCGAGALEDLRLYKPAVRRDGSLCDWGESIRCDSIEAPHVMMKRACSIKSHATASCLRNLKSECYYSPRQCPLVPFMHLPTGPEDGQGVSKRGNKPTCRSRIDPASH